MKRPRLDAIVRVCNRIRDVVQVYDSAVVILLMHEIKRVEGNIRISTWVTSRPISTSSLLRAFVTAALIVSESEEDNLSPINDIFATCSFNVARNKRAKARSESGAPVFEST